MLYAPKVGSEDWGISPKTMRSISTVISGIRMLLAKLKLVLRIGRRADFSLVRTKLKLVLQKACWRTDFSLVRTKLKLVLREKLCRTGFNLAGKAKACATTDCRTGFIELKIVSLSLFILVSNLGLYKGCLRIIKD